MRVDLQKKQREVEQWEEKYQNETSALAREAKDWERKYQTKTKDYNELKRELERRIAEIESLNDIVVKTQKKVVFKQEELDKEVKEHEKTL